METKVTKQFGSATYEFTFNGKFKDVMKQSAFLMQPDNYGLAWQVEGFTGEEEIRFDVRTAKTDDGDFTYVKRLARSKDGRTATSTLGEYKDGGYFWKAWEVYEGQDKNENGTLKPDAEEVSPSDIPF